jgi:hypothetical protein
MTKTKKKKRESNTQHGHDTFTYIKLQTLNGEI